MDRQIVYPGSIPLDTDLLSAQRNAMVALGYLAQAALGSGIVIDGLACSPTAPASLTITIGPGSISSLNVIDSGPFGSLSADNTDPLVKMGIAIKSTSFTLTAPATSGQSINYLLQATLAEIDATPIVLPYYNAANPTQPFSGPANNGTPQNTQRLQQVQLQLKPSPPANAGSQVTPAVDSGWVGLYVVTVSYGQTQITTASTAVYPGRRSSRSSSIRSRRASPEWRPLPRPETSLYRMAARAPRFAFAAAAVAVAQAPKA